MRADPAARLPETYCQILLNPLQVAEPLSPERFVRATAAWIEGATEETALWGIGPVLSTVAEAAGDVLTRDILLQLLPGYDLLFGHPDPLTTATTLNPQRTVDEKGDRTAMYDRPLPDRTSTAMTFDQMLERVCYEGEGAYATRERAAGVIHAVLAALDGYALLFGQAQLRQPQLAA
ncbi:hypothetical protein EES41_01285 [Streptomyces sp. ADI95-16]|nr:hypothetical protein EES41_01285 [Streptomyces sp. ADI95-16]